MWKIIANFKLWLWLIEKVIDVLFLGITEAPGPFMIGSLKSYKNVLFNKLLGVLTGSNVR